jgi:hypothetical protein
MNYKKHYNRLIKRTRDRVLEGYSERHHVKPHCLGGGDEAKNIVRLTAEEHFVAHQLLVKMHPGHRGLVHAAWAMARDAYGTRLNNKRFGWLKRLLAEAVSDRHTGKIMSAKSRRKLSAAKKGKPNGTLGLHHSEETKRKIGASNAISQLGKKHSKKTRMKMGLARLGNTNAAGGKGWETRRLNAALKNATA